MIQIIKCKEFVNVGHKYLQWRYIKNNNKIYNKKQQQKNPSPNRSGQVRSGQVRVFNVHIQSKLL